MECLGDAKRSASRTDRGGKTTDLPTNGMERIEQYFDMHAPMLPIAHKYQTKRLIIGKYHNKIV